MSGIFNYFRGGSKQPSIRQTKQKEFTTANHELGTKRQRGALENITNQTKNNLVVLTTAKQKSAKKSKIQPKETKPAEQEQKSSRRNSITSRRKRKSSVGDSVVPHFADMDLSATPSAPSASEKRSQTQETITLMEESMQVESSTTITMEDEMEEEEIIDDDEEEEEIAEEEDEEEEERERERDAKRNDKVQRQKQQQQGGEASMALSLRDDEDSLPTGCTNIDALDENDPQWATVYVNQIYDNLKENERKYLLRVCPYIDTVQKAVTCSMRGVLVDWLVEVAEEYELSSETLYLSVNFLDRFLSQETVDRRKFQLVGVACMLIASKYEEIYAPAIDEFVYISANTYKREEILLMEILILNTLNFDLTAATAKVFLRRYLKAASADLTLAFLSSYLAELSLQEYSFIQYPPSLVAAAAVFLALRTLGREPWTPTLQYYTKYQLEDPLLQKCIHELYKIQLAAPTNSLKAIHEKYSDSRFRKVAKIPPPVVDPQNNN